MVSNALAMGGVWMYVAMGFGAVGGLMAVIVAFAFGFAKWRLPMTIGWLGFTFAALTASVASILSRMSFTSAMSTATAEMRSTMLASAIAENLYTQTGLLMVLPLMFLVFALAAAIPTAIAVGDEPKFDGRGLLGGFAGAVVGLLLAVGGLAMTLGLLQYTQQGPSFLFLPIMMMMGTVATLVASLRVSGSSRLDQGRTAASRMAVAVAASLAVVLLGYFFTSIGVIQAFEAVAMAAPDMKSEMMAVGLEVAGYATTTGWCFALVPLCAGLGSATHILGRIEGRQWAGMVVASVQLVLILGSLLFIASTTAWMFRQLVGTL